jgi:AcrR family transcriptional regulator
LLSSAARFYAHFASKGDLVVAAMSQMFDEASVKFDRLTTGRCGPISTSTCLGSIATLATRAVHIV